MGQINISKTDTPELPTSDRIGLFFNNAGQPKTVDSEGNEQLLAGIAEAPVDGNEYVRKDGAWEQPATAYPEASLRENNTVLFDGDYIIGNAGARTGNILFDFAGAKLGATTTMRHNDASAFTFPSEAVLMFDSADISTTADNYFLFVLVDKTASSQVVHVFHAMEGGIA